MSEPNPLVQQHFRIPFDKVQAEHVEPAIRTLLEEAKRKLEALTSDPAPRTWENTMQALDRLTEPLEYGFGIVRHLESVATSPPLRAAFNAVQPDVSAFFSSLPLNAGLWRAVRAFADTDEARALTGARRRFLTKTIDSFKRHGAELDDAGKARLQEIDVELAQLTTKFAENTLDSTNDWELFVHDAAELAGLPPSAVEQARASAQSKGADGWRFTLQQPSYIAVMTYLDDSDRRREFWRAHSTRATEPNRDNRPLIARILELRRAKATLLGFRDFADFVLADRMAHTGGRAEEFLIDLKKKTERRFEQENQELREFAGRELGGWDIAYWAEKQRKALYDFDEEELRPYFPLESVVRGMFEIVGRLYGIRVVAVEGAPVWDPAVKYYEIRDERGGTLLGAFYADWYPRENKRGGAWMDAFITGITDENVCEPHAGLICGNLTPPVGDKPALLTHRDVETIFHEFGHLLHHSLSRVEVRSLAGANVAWDFVELPSQIMENWCWEREALDLFARHYQTGEPIPEPLFQRMKRARTFRAANGQMRQLGFGLVDLALHRDYQPEQDGDVMEYARRILQQFSPAPLPDDYAMIAGFTHLFASPVGYGAGYYSYKWAEVLDADAFTRFRADGIFSPDVGAAFRDRILSRGDSDDPAELYRAFMGRDPDPNALLERSGLL
ncbi:MAG TPA: M3 family metallopeptidase, partial [Bryobacteraceae bacterium]|nr:M3 family metallopeptidase [Bryobacteraceae bacterium]